MMTGIFRLVDAAAADCLVRARPRPQGWPNNGHHHIGGISEMNQSTGASWPWPRHADTTTAMDEGHAVRQATLTTRRLSLEKQIQVQQQQQQQHDSNTGDARSAKAPLIQTRVSCRGLCCQGPSTPRKPRPADDGRPDLDKSSHAQESVRIISAQGEKRTMPAHQRVTPPARCGAVPSSASQPSHR